MTNIVLLLSSGICIQWQKHFGIYYCSSLAWFLIMKTLLKTQRSKQPAQGIASPSGSFDCRSNLMTTSDGVHPNKDGYNYMAKLVFDFMVKKRIVKQCSFLGRFLFSSKRYLLAFLFFSVCFVQDQRELTAWLVFQLYGELERILIIITSGYNYLIN